MYVTTAKHRSLTGRNFDKFLLNFIKLFLMYFETCKKSIIGQGFTHENFKAFPF